MEPLQNFRTAFHGFNREDVVQYIEYINNKHTSQTNQLKTEIQDLQDKVAELKGSTVSDARLAELEARCVKLEQERNEAYAKLAQLPAAPAPAPVPVPAPAPAPAPAPVSDELEAYRRAERTERMARERVAQMYSQASSILTNAMAKVDEAAAQIETMTNDVAVQLDQLRTAVTGSKCALKDAVTSMHALRPESEK